MVMVKNITNRNILKIQNNNDTFYKILMDTHDKMIANNMIVEILNPTNQITKKMHLSKMFPIRIQ